MTSIRPGCEATVDHGPDCPGVGDVEQLAMECVGVLLAEPGDAVRPSDSADHGVAPSEELGGELPAESAAHAGDEPGALGHVVSCHCLWRSVAKPLAPRATRCGRCRPRPEG